MFEGIDRCLFSGMKVELVFELRLTPYIQSLNIGYCADKLVSLWTVR
ncbi:hypothetical protein GCM10011346_02140 [Oceanobacillus neutriphilus]|uniref:Uncharacterized protein n=1 Tax=Oceanobacillus neutriphilus TaxID=531815 RepID=A0ABQ2NMJ7_9BACI|nr:hypothetical protein GCM10011346_02140 [Oceanobacillus neutriphilus]